jgi:hypothetical protein
MTNRAERRRMRHRRTVVEMPLDEWDPLGSMCGWAGCYNTCTNEFHPGWAYLIVDDAPDLGGADDIEDDARKGGARGAR